MLKRFVVLVLGVLCLAGMPAAADTQASPSPAPVSAQPALAIAYDQVDRQLGGNATPPPPEAFNDEVQAALDARKSTGISMPAGPSLGQEAIEMIPGIGMIYGMAQAKKQQDAAKKAEQEAQDQLSGNKPPVLTRYAFYNGWTRVETANSIIIAKPDQHVTIFIDPQAKTYHTYDTSGAAQIEAAPSAAPQSESGASSATAIESSGQAATITIDGQPTVGFSQDALVTLSGSSGSCHDGTFRAKKLVYYAQMAEPLPDSKVTPLDSLALPEGCSATIALQTSGTAEPAGQMWLYKLVTVVRDPNVQTQTGNTGNFDFSGMMQGPQQSAGLPPNYMLFSERGNIRQLSAADASLFDVPAGYTEDK